MSRLRVAIVAPSLDFLGGQAVQARRLIDAWRDDPEVDAWLVPHNPIPPGFLSHARKVKYLRTIVTELTYIPLIFREIARADVVHVFSAAYTSFLLAPLPALLAAKLLKRPAILNYRSGQGPDHLKRSRLARRVIAHTDCTIVPSAFLVDVFASFGLQARAVPNLLDLERFQYRRRTRPGPRIISVRNFEPLYDIACTLRAFQIVQQRRPDASLTLVGGGSGDAALRALARELQLTQVNFAGRVKPDEMPPWYAGHDIYIQSPRIDNAPTSVLEAYASGLPVVSTDAGGVPAILTHGEHGLLAPVGDHQALAAHILRLLDEPELAVRLADQARATCSRHAWPSVRSEWLRTYHGLVSSQAVAVGNSPALREL
jgi:glycosyltransferase involved in cell wall biosynthesis